MREYTDDNGTTIKLYTEHKYLLPLFDCPLCGVESYYFTQAICDSCRVEKCRSCNKHIKGEKHRVFFNKKFHDNEIRPFVCLECYKDNF